MMIKNQPNEYLLLFHSADDVPPPLAFHALIRIGPPGEKNQINIECNREFVGREDIPVQEIEAEGFSTDDDFNWTGMLPAFWLEDFLQMLEHTDWKPATETQVLLSFSGHEEWLSPSDEKRWIRFCEELLQACLEEGGKELPMEMVLGELLKNNFFESIWLEWRFARREIHAAVKNGPQAAFSSRDWEEAEEQLKIWMEDEAKNKDLYQLPPKKGMYWLMNNELWLPDRKKLRGRLWEWVEQHRIG